MSNNEVVALANKRLLSYCALMDPNFVWPEHILQVAELLEAVERGEVSRAMINMPPRHGKSHLTSIHFPAWFIGRNPNKKIMTATYALNLALDFGRQVRNLVNDPLHLASFPGCRLSADSAAAERFNTTKKGAYYAMGVGGALTGRGADLLLIDDPIKGQEDADSEVMREKLKSWYRSVAYTRLEKDAKIIIIQTRWHEDDLSGWLLNAKEQDKVEDWRILNLPAIAEKDEGWRKEGDPLWEEKYDAYRLNEMRRAVGGRTWSALYQQRPAAAEGVIFKRDWWKEYRFDPLLIANARVQNVMPPPNCPRLLRVYQAWDTAQGEKEENDYSACVTFGLGADGNFYLLDVWRGRVGLPALKKQVYMLASKWRPNQILIESKSSGQSLLQEIRNHPSIKLPIKAIFPDRDKVSRAHAVTPTCEAGNVYVPSPDVAPWLADFIDELAAFPVGTHDDMVDATVYALDRMLHSVMNLDVDINSEESAQAIVSPY